MGVKTTHWRSELGLCPALGVRDDETLLVIKRAGIVNVEVPSQSVEVP